MGEDDGGVMTILGNKVPRGEKENVGLTLGAWP